MVKLSEHWIEEIQSIFLRAYTPAGDLGLFPVGGVIPPNDPSTLFTTAGIQHWRQWVLSTAAGDKAGRLGCHWCARMTKFDLVGTTNFLTSFCMLSHVVRRQMDRVEVIATFVKLLVDGFDMDSERLGFQLVGAGPTVPADKITAEALKALGFSTRQIGWAARKWAHPFCPLGPTGPELFLLYDSSRIPCGDTCGATCECGRYIHFWNLEFLDFEIAADGRCRPASVPYVDSAGCLEWLATVFENRTDVYRSSPFRTATALVRALRRYNDTSGDTQLTRQEKILIDHCRTIALIYSAGIVPSAKKQGSVLRRLIKKSLCILEELGIELECLNSLVDAIAQSNAGQPGFGSRSGVQVHLADEIERYKLAVTRARRAYDHLREGSEIVPNKLYQIECSYGVPRRLLLSWLAQDGFSLEAETFAACTRIAQATSRGSNSFKRQSL